MKLKKEVSDELKVVNNIGVIDEKGHWKPDNEGYKFSPLFDIPPKVKESFLFVFGPRGYIARYFIYVLLAIGTYYLLEQDILAFEGITFKFVGLMHLRNLALMFFVYGGYHFVLYTLKLQGNEQKYNPKWQIKNSKRFLFHNQVYDNVFRSVVSGASFWTAYEVLYVWMFSKGWLPYVSFSQHPVYFIALLFIIPIVKEVHFYTIHRILHWGPLLRKIHSVHHMNPNPAPWSGMAMHPVEHLLYFSVVLFQFIVPSHPIHFFFNSQLTALSPAGVHTGFEGPLFKRTFTSGDYFHYLHHKHVACNYGGGTIPMDRWFNTFFNGEGKFRPRRKKK